MDKSRKNRIFDSSQPFNITSTIGQSTEVPSLAEQILLYKPREFRPDQLARKQENDALETLSGLAKLTRYSKRAAETQRSGATSRSVIQPLNILPSPVSPTSGRTGRYAGIGQKELPRTNAMGTRTRVERGLSAGFDSMKGPQSAEQPIGKSTASRIVTPGAPEDPITLSSAAAGRWEGQNLCNYENPAHEPLRTKCVRVLVANFETMPAAYDALPKEFVKEIAQRLPLDLNADVAAGYVFDENYWKRRCMVELGWGHSSLARHGMSWKQLRLERYLQDRLENYDPSIESVDSLLSSVISVSDYIFNLKVEQLLSHLDVHQVWSCLPNLTKLELTYGVKKIGMRYDRMLFGMKISDAGSLTNYLQATSTLVSLLLPKNMIDDDVLRMLMTGMARNYTVTTLDLSHNRISNHGARLLAKLVGTQACVISTLNLEGNEIHPEGGRSFGRALRQNTTLTDLSLRLNRLGDDGAKMLCDGLKENGTLLRLDISANGAGDACCVSLSNWLKEPRCRLQVLHLSSNDISLDGLASIRDALYRNSYLISIDVRLNPRVYGRELVANLVGGDAAVALGLGQGQRTAQALAAAGGFNVSMLTESSLLSGVSKAGGSGGGAMGKDGTGQAKDDASGSGSSGSGAGDGTGGGGGRGVGGGDGHGDGVGDGGGSISAVPDLVSEILRLVHKNELQQFHMKMTNAGSGPGSGMGGGGGSGLGSNYGYPGSNRMSNQI